jgi:hypothetical protein
MEWKVKFDSYEKLDTMPLDRAKIESLRAIAEQLEAINKSLMGMRKDSIYTPR